MNVARDVQYALGGAASGVASTVPSALLLYFSTAILGVSPGIAALILFGPKVLALIGDPLFGRLFDRFSDRPAQRAALLAAGGGVMAVGLVLVFAPPVLDPGVATDAWLAIAYLVFCAGYSLFSVSHIAGPSTLANDDGARARLVGWRMTAVLIGILIGAAGAPMVVAAGGGGRPGYAIMASIAAIVLVPLTLGPTRILARQASAASNGPAPLFGALKIAAFRPVVLTYALLMAAVSALTAALPYWLIERDGGTEADVGLYLGLMLASSIVCAPLWTLLVRRRGEAVGYLLLLCSYLIIAPMLALLLLTATRGAAGMVVFVLLGAAFAGLQVVPFTMLARIAADASLRAGAAMEGMVSGTWTAAEKLGLASGPALTGLLLALSNGRPGIILDMGIALAMLAAAATGLVMEWHGRATYKTLRVVA